MKGDLNLRKSKTIFVECVCNTGRSEITVGKIYEVISVVKDSKGKSFYKIKSDTDKIRHYDLKYFIGAKNENTEA